MDQFQQLADFMPQLVWMARPDGSVDYYNKQWYDYTGFAEGYGDQSWLPILHPDDVQHCMDTWYGSVRTGEGYEIEYRFKDRKNPGQYRWFLGRACPIKDDDGRVVRWFGTCTDIDDQKRQTEVLERRVAERTAELDQLNRALQASNEALQQFAYVASHDLQEPLRKIRGFGDLFISQHAAQISSDGIDMIQRMQSAAGRMSTLIRDLLDYSRLSVQPEAFSRIELTDVLSEVTHDLDIGIEQAGAELHIDPMPSVRGNATQLRQLFQNLLTNALKFRRPGVLPEIRVSCRRVVSVEIPVGLELSGVTSPFWEISVADNGIGFDEQYVDRIFQVFQRLHGRTKYDGSGVGLAICRRVVERHGGGITARSKPGEGTTFLVYLPV